MGKCLLSTDGLVLKSDNYGKSVLKSGGVLKFFKLILSLLYLHDWNGGSNYIYPNVQLFHLISSWAVETPQGRSKSLVTVPGSNLAYPLASGMVLELDSPACNAGRDSLAKHRRAVLSDTFLCFCFFWAFLPDVLLTYKCAKIVFSSHWENLCFLMKTLICVV